MITEFNVDGLPVKCHHKRDLFSFFVTTGLVATVLSIVIVILVPSSDVLRLPVAGMLAVWSLFSTAMSCWIVQTKDDWLQSQISKADFDRLSYFLEKADQSSIDLPK